MQFSEGVTYIGQTNKRPPYKTFGIKDADRFHHIYVIGRTGTGKSTLLETLATQDILRNHGLAVIDPHGDLVERLRKRIPPERADELVYLNPARGAQLRYNPLRKVRADKIPLAVSGVLEAFKKIWGAKAWGVRMEHVLRNSLFALIEYGDATMPDLLRIVTDKAFRQTVLARVKNEEVRRFWFDEFSKYNPFYRQDAIGPIQNKVGALLADRRMHALFTAMAPDLSVRRLMDEGKILLVILSKGELGEDSANLLGAMLVTTISLAAFSRAELAESERRDFFAYIDEFQSFTTLAVANMVSELRKYRVGLTLAHQQLGQLEPDVRHAVLGNAGTLIAFRLGAEDAALIARELAPRFHMEDLLGLPNRSVYLRLMVDGAPTPPFSATTIAFNDLEDLMQ